MSNWLRYASITIEGGGANIDASELRCKFKITQNIVKTPDQLELTIYNMSKETAQKVVSGEATDKLVTLDIGYQDNHSVMFKGQLKQAIYGRENPTDTFLWCLATGEWGYNYAVVNKTLKAGSTQQDVFDELMKPFKKFGASVGTIGPNLSEVKYPQPVVLFGMARDFIQTIAVSHEATWFLDTTGKGGELNMIKKDKSIDGGGVKLNSGTGLIGMPQQTMDGIIARCLINPKIRPQRTVIIDQSSVQQAKGNILIGGSLDTVTKNKLPGIAADGTYIVVKMDVSGDTRGQEWYMDLVCINKDKPGNGPNSRFVGQQ